MVQTVVMGSWYEKSGVRSDLHRDECESESKLFWPTHLVPHLDHPLVKDHPRDLTRFLAAQYAYESLNFNMEFELSVVVATTATIANGSSGVAVGRDYRRDALKICVDETYHSAYSADVVDQMEQTYRIEAPSSDFAPVLALLDQKCHEFPGYEKLVRLMQTIIFETSVTTMLDGIADDDSVMTPIRDITRDHIADEVRHHAYFAQFFKQLWAQLSDKERTMMTLAVPDIMVSAGSVFAQPASGMLRSAGFTETEVQQIVSETGGDGFLLEDDEAIFRKTLGLFQRSGMMDIPGARDNFLAAGFASVGA